MTGRTASMAGLAVMAIAVSPPIEAAVERSLAVHMAQHLALVVAAPGLLALDRPFAVVASLAPSVERRLTAASAWFHGPVAGRAALAAASAHVLVVSAWHLPALYDAAAGSIPLHLVEHGTFIGVGWATWVAVRSASRCVPASAIAALFLVAAQGAALGAVLTFAPAPLYETVAADPLADQQLAGLLMWVPGGAPYAAVAAVVAARTLAERAAVGGPAVVQR